MASNSAGGGQKASATARSDFINAVGTFKSSASTKGAVLPPVVAKSASHLELREMMGTNPTQDYVPVEEDIMKLAMAGDVKGIQYLLDVGKFAATHKDDTGVTPLHVRGCPLLGKCES